MSIVAIALCLSFALLLLLLFRPPPPPAIPPPSPRRSPVSARHVSFSVITTDTSFSLSPPPVHSLPIQRRWSSPFHRRKHSASDSPHSAVDQFGRLPPSPSLDSLPSPKSPGRLRWSLPGKRRSSQPASPVSSPPPSMSSAPPQRAKFVNPFSKHSRSRALSLPATFNPSEPSSNLSGIPPSAGRRTLASKFKSIFKPTPDSPPTTPFKPLPKIRPRRKLVSRTQPYAPPWNAPMPFSISSIPQHSLQEHVEPAPPSRPTLRKPPVQGSFSEQISASPGQLFSPTFLDALDEKLLLLEQQRI